jgi:GR25 family glycosyltransferase involved in LPS biosynthesis
MNCYLINLKERTDKLGKSLEVLLRLGIAPKIFEAIKPVSNPNHRSTGQRGCYESHIGVLKSISKENCADNTIFAVVEDDILLGRVFRQHQKKVLDLFSSCCDKVDLVYLHTSTPEQTTEVSLVDAPDQVATHMYLVTKRSAGKIAAILEKMLVTSTYPVDCDLMNPEIIKKKTNITMSFQNVNLASDITAQSVAVVMEFKHLFNYLATEQEV